MVSILLVARTGYSCIVQACKLYMCSIHVIVLYSTLQYCVYAYSTLHGIQNGINCCQSNSVTGDRVRLEWVLGNARYLGTPEPRPPSR